MDVVFDQHINSFEGLIKLTLFHVLGIVVHMRFAIVKPWEVLHLGAAGWSWNIWNSAPEKCNKFFGNVQKSRLVAVWLNIWCAAQVFPKCKTEYGRPRGATLQRPILGLQNLQRVCSSTETKQWTLWSNNLAAISPLQSHIVTCFWYSSGFVELWEIGKI